MRMRKLADFLPIQTVRTKDSLLIGHNLVGGSIAHREPEFIDIIDDILYSPAKEMRQ